MSIVIINNKPEPLSHFKGLSTICCNVEDITIRNDWGFKPIIEQRPIYFVSPANGLFFFSMAESMQHIAECFQDSSK